MQKYFRNGASAWQYWNLALPVNGMSGWEWPQNALVSVDTIKGTYRLTHDYWLMRHLSAHVRIGAHYLPTVTSLGYDNALAFRNPNGDAVLVMFNEMADPLPLVISLGKQQLALTLPADSFSTVLIPARHLQA
ncbi:glycoside hydrolase family 30 beta sandwich domain-containing protein [Roseateles cellulosilyticus]|uniref:Glycosyl hydrolase family 30 beta sandwich domain-containing protein n=1 Tax=Pelomonas cellulosilytica TaxID=2906762 RepID=A0ABS8XML3_9BURK|nr:glycoside hydrolase family 30 beta sandwich domain-containing protein [Pelomonas sp. P8]MCE4552862.1 hypothetical protein [Pelomonas sp. P8]